MNSWRVILATVVIFATGVMTGGLLVNHVEHTHPRNFHRAPPPVSTSSQTNSQSQPRPAADLSKPRLPEILSKDFMQKLDDLLHLAPEQHDAIQKIIIDGQGETRKVMQDARQQIREQLTPDQRKQFEELMKRPPRKQPAVTNAPATLPLSAMTNAPGV